nr:hypothetical protein [Tanacetum cinerariifolium]
EVMCGGYEIRCGGLGSRFDELDGVRGAADFMEKKEEMWPFLGPRNVLRGGGGWEVDGDSALNRIIAALEDDEEEKEESSRDDADEDEDEDEDEEEHLAPTDFIPPPPVHRTTARISIPAQAPVSFMSEAKILSCRIKRIPQLPIHQYPAITRSYQTDYEEPSDVGSPGVVVYGYDGLPMHPPSLDYVLRLEHPPSPDYVPGLKHPPSSAYVPEFVSEPSNPEEDDEDPVDYPTDREDDEEEKEEAAMIRLRADSLSTSHPPPPIVLPHTRASISMMRATAPSTYILAPRSEVPPCGTPLPLPIPLPTSSPPLLLPFTDYRADVPEVTLPPRKRLCIALGPRFKVKESSSTPTARPTGGFRADYGFVGTMDAEVRRDPDRKIGYEITDVWEDPDEIAKEIPTTDVAELGKRMTDFVTTVRHDTDEIYGRLDDAHDDRLLMSGQLNMLRRDRRSHARTARLIEKNGTKKNNKVNTSHNNNHHHHPYNHDSGTSVRRQAPPARHCTYPYFIKCKPLYFKGTKGVVELTRWFERMETVLRISNCTTVGHDVAYAMTWTNLKKKTTDKYCPRGEIKKLEVEMWNLKVKGTDVVSYNQRIQELALMCARMFPEESDKIKRYVGGLPDMIHESVIASKLKTMQDAVEFATELLDKKIRTFAEHQTENKRKFEDTSKRNQNQQQNKK